MGPAELFMVAEKNESDWKSVVFCAPIDPYISIVSEHGDNIK